MKCPQTTLSALMLALTFVASSSLSSVAAESKAPERAIVTKTKSIVLPEFKVDDVTLVEGIDRLLAAAIKNDPESKGVNFMVDRATAAASPKITLALKNVTVMEAVERLAQSAGVFATAEDYAFVFRPKTELGAVELVAGKPTQFNLGAGKCCKIVGQQQPEAIHLKLTMLSTNAGGMVLIQALREITTAPGKRCDISLGDKMISMIPTLKTP